MHTTPSLFQGRPLRLGLDDGDVYTLHVEEQVRLACLSGSLWVTLDHDLRDIVLEPGDSWIVPVGKHCLLYALAAAELRIEPLQAMRPRRWRTPWGLPAWRPFLPRLA